ncbi:MAG: addiction module antidote protein [Nitrospirales bacterium]
MDAPSGLRRANGRQIWGGRTNSQGSNKARPLRRASLPWARRKASEQRQCPINPKKSKDIENGKRYGTSRGWGYEKIKAYQLNLIKTFRVAGEAEEYLNAALEEGDSELFLLALRNVAKAQGGVAQLAEKAKLNRESLYKILSERGNPELKSLDALLHALGFRLAITANR